MRTSFLGFIIVPYLLVAQALPATKKFPKTPKPSKKKSLGHFSLGSVSPCNGDAKFCNLRILDQYTFPGTHNTETDWSNMHPNDPFVDNCNTGCQSNTLKTQFSNGIRSFHLEVCQAENADKDLLFGYPGYGKTVQPEDAVICHGSSLFWAYGRPVKDIFTDILSVLQSSNSDVIRVDIEPRGEKIQDTSALLNNIRSYFMQNLNSAVSYVPQNVLTGNPTLGSLASQNQRILFFTNSLFDNDFWLIDYAADWYDGTPSNTIPRAIQACQTPPSQHLYISNAGNPYGNSLSWKIQFQIGWDPKKLFSCVADYAKSSNSDTNLQKVFSTCQSNQLHVSVMEVDYFEQWNGRNDLQAYQKAINAFNYAAVSS